MPVRDGQTRRAAVPIVQRGGRRRPRLTASGWPP